jgi:hypothetical protein
MNLEFQEDEQYATFPLLSVIGKKNVKPETMLYNINKTINTNDTSNIDFTTNGRNGHTLEPLSTIFCDNIVLYSIIPNIELLQHQNMVKFIAKAKADAESKPTTTEAQDEAEGDKSNIFKPFLGAITAKICNALQAKGI